MIADIRLQYFRSYKDATFEFGSGVNIIVGPNASGKTNLLEAVMVVCQGSSYKAKDSEVIMHNKPWARIDARADESARSVKMQLVPSGSVRKTFVIGGQELARLNLSKAIPAVLFEPEHLQLLSGSPELRRDYLDDLLGRTVAGYDKLRRDYRRTLSQRNALLKRGSGAARNQIFAWNIRLSELGGQIASQRAQLVDGLNAQAQAVYKKLSGSKAQVTLSYVSAIAIENYSSKLLRKLELNQQLDLARGFTGHGPHRDDLKVELAGHDAQSSASRGEVRTLILMLKILELKLLEQQSGKRPILLLDDVFSELDGKRRQALTRFLKDYQTFITTTDADVVVQHFIDKATIIPTSK
jgi:DNA replication and repair protein RecF